MECIVCDHCGGHCSAKSIFHNSIIFTGAENQSNAGVFIGLFYIPVKCFQIKIQLPHVFWAEFINLQFNRNQTSECPVLTLPTAKAGGFSVLRSLPFKERSYAISLSVRFRRVPPYRLYTNYASRRSPSFKIFCAALMSLSWIAPQFGHFQSRTNKSFVPDH